MSSSSVVGMRCGSIERGRRFLARGDRHRDGGGSGFEGGEIEDGGWRMEDGGLVADTQGGHAEPYPGNCQSYVDPLTVIKNCPAEYHFDQLPATSYQTEPTLNHR